eukprot:Skav205227  [mRNA]  locus=scaffold1794:38037:38562:+ [translate_table: standard]
MARAINRSLLDQYQIKEEISVDKADFLNHYARTLLTFSQLTQHQQMKLKELCSYPDQDLRSHFGSSHFGSRLAQESSRRVPPVPVSSGISAVPWLVPGGYGRHHLCRTWCFAWVAWWFDSPHELELAFTLGFDSLLELELDQKGTAKGRYGGSCRQLHC